MRDWVKIKRQKRQRRAKRVRAKIFGTLRRPRLAVFRSHKHIYVQLIDDEQGKTLASVSDLGLDKKAIKSAKAALSAAKEKIKIAHLIGKLIAKKAGDLEIKEAVFDRRGYQYHGRVKAAAEGAREEGLKF